jgi:hypothetical protein
MMRQSKKNLKKGNPKNAFSSVKEKQVLALTIELIFFIAVLNYDETIRRLILITKSNKQWKKSKRVIHNETFFIESSSTLKQYLIV